MECPDAADLEWLTEFLSPQFRVLETIFTDFTVKVEEDQHYFEFLWEELSKRQPNPLENTFVLDQTVVRLPSTTLNDGSQALYDETCHVFYLFPPKAGPIKILRRSQEHSIRTSLMRVVRELLAAPLGIADQNLMLHAACVAIGDSGVIIAGPKNAGKTSLLIHLLHHPSAQYLSNDRILLNKSDSGLDVQGIPSIVSIRNETLQFFPALRTQFDMRHSLFAKRLRTTPTSAGPIADFTRKKCLLSPAQLCELLRVKAIAQTKAWVVLFPRITDHEESSIVTRSVSPEAAADHLFHSVFGSGHRTGNSIFGKLHGVEKNKELDGLTLVQDLASRFHCCECLMGANSYRESSEKLVAELAAQIDLDHA